MTNSSPCGTASRRTSSLLVVLLAFACVAQSAAAQRPAERPDAPAAFDATTVTWIPGRVSLGIQHYRFRLAPPGDIIGAVGLFGGLHVGAHPHTLPEGEEVRLVYVTGNAGLTFTPSRRVGLWAGLGASSRHVSHEQLGPRSRLAPNLLVGLSAHATSRLTLSAGAQTTPASLLVGVGYIW